MRKKLTVLLFLFVFLVEHFQAFFYFMCHSQSRVLTASGQFLDVACSDTVFIVDPTPYHAVRAVPSTDSVINNPASGSRHRSFPVGFPTL